MTNNPKCMATTTQTKKNFSQSERNSNRCWRCRNNKSAISSNNNNNNYIQLYINSRNSCSKRRTCKTPSAPQTHTHTYIHTYVHTSLPHTYMHTVWPPVKYKGNVWCIYTPHAIWYLPHATHHFPLQIFRSKLVSHSNAASVPQMLDCINAKQPAHSQTTPYPAPCTMHSLSELAAAAQTIQRCIMRVVLWRFHWQKTPWVWKTTSRMEALSVISSNLLTLATCKMQRRLAVTCIQICVHTYIHTYNRMCIMPIINGWPSHCQDFNAQSSSVTVNYRNILPYRCSSWRLT